MRFYLIMFDGDTLAGLESINNESVFPGMELLRARANPVEFKSIIDSLLQVASLRHMTTRRGQRLSAAMSNCGQWGWVSDNNGYRYQEHDPETGLAWPSMPADLRSFATDAAALAGFNNFIPDACLINRYEVGASMGAHQDADESDFSQPIVSVSLGLPVRFFVGSVQRGGKTRAVDLSSGDVVVFGGASRLRYHGVRPLKSGHDPVFGACRFNLTFRRAR